MEYIIGNHETGKVVGRTPSPITARGVATRNGLDPVANIYTPDRWLQARQDAVDAAHSTPKDPTRDRATMTGQADTHSDIAEERQRRMDAIQDEIAVNLLGKTEWAKTAPVRTRAHRMNSVGEANLTTMIKEWEGGEPIGQTLRRVADEIDAEQRKPVDFRADAVRMDLNADGQLVLKRHPANKGLPMTEHTLKSFMSYFPQFQKIAPALLASEEDGGLPTNSNDKINKVEVFNRYLVDRVAPDIEVKLVEANAKVAERNKKRKKGTDPYERPLRATTGDLIMWCRMGPGGTEADPRWQAFHISSPSHSSKHVNAADYARIVADVLEGCGYRGEVTYDHESSTLTFSAWLMPDHMIDPAANDIVKSGLSGSTSDTNQGPYDAFISFLRNLCLNLIVLAFEHGKLYSIPHNASAERIREDVYAALRSADTSMDKVRELWDILCKPMPGFDPTDDENVKVVLEAARQAAGFTARTNAERDAIVEAMHTAWTAEGADASYKGVLNAMSRLHLDKRREALGQELDDYQVARLTGAYMQDLVRLANKDRPIVDYTPKVAEA